MQLQGHPSRWGSGRAAAAAGATSPTPPAMTQRPVLPPAARRIVTAQVSFDLWCRRGSPVSDWVHDLSEERLRRAHRHPPPVQRRVVHGRAGTRPRQRARTQPDAWTSWNTRVSEAIAVRLHRHLAKRSLLRARRRTARRGGWRSACSWTRGGRFLPRQLPHAFVVTSPQAWFLTAHIRGFDRFTLAVGTPATGTTTMPPQEVPPDPAALAAIASSFGIEILGPPLTP